MRKIEEVIKLLNEINQKLEMVNKKEEFPRLIYTKELSEKYPINRNTATQFCKKYGIYFGGYCIEADKLKEVLQNEGFQALKQRKKEVS